MIMKIEELPNEMKKRFPFPDPRRYAGGNMCFNCGRSNCKFVLTGDMFYGQEVGKDERGNVIVYECPKYTFPTHEWDPWYEWQRDVRETINYMEYLVSTIDELNLYAKTSYTYRKYSK